MEPWEQKLDDTQLATRIQSLNEKLTSYDEDALSVDDRAYLNRIKAINEQLAVVLENTPAELISLSTAISIANSISNIISYLDNWTSTGNSTYLNNQ